VKRPKVKNKTNFLASTSFPLSPLSHLSLSLSHLLSLSHRDIKGKKGERERDKERENIQNERVEIRK
jgi:hypothetical protein